MKKLLLIPLILLSFVVSAQNDITMQFKGPVPGVSDIDSIGYNYTGGFPGIRYLYNTKKTRQVILSYVTATYFNGNQFINPGDIAHPISLKPTGVTAGSCTNCNLTIDSTGRVLVQGNGSGGGMSTISIATANGFGGSSSGGATPVLTLNTTVTGLVKGNGTAISAATAGTDYLTPTGNGSGLTNFTSGQITTALGFTPENVANKATDFTTLNNTKYPTTQAVANYVANKVKYATSAGLPSNTYSSGVLTATANGALTVDGVSPSVNDPILVHNETDSTKNGIYDITQIGSVSTPYILTRDANFNTPLSLQAGSNVFVTNGNTESGQSFYQVTTGTVVIGTTKLVYTVPYLASNNSIAQNITQRPNFLNGVINLGVDYVGGQLQNPGAFGAYNAGSAGATLFSSASLLSDFVIANPSVTSNAYATNKYRAFYTVPASGTINDYRIFLTFKATTVATLTSNVVELIVDDAPGINTYVDYYKFPLSYGMTSGVWYILKPLMAGQSYSTSHNNSIEIMYNNSTKVFSLRNRGFTTSTTGPDVWIQINPLYDLTNTSTTGNDATTLTVLPNSQLTIAQATIHDGAGNAFLKQGTIIAGTGVTLSTSGDNLTINASGGGGSGTVTNFSATNSQGVTTTVTNPTTTPNLAIGLGNITPTSINTTHLPANIFQTPTGTAGTDSLAVKIGATGKIGAIAAGTYLTPSSTNVVTNKDLTSGTNTFPTLNQNTTGSAAKLTTARNINGVAFDGTANISVNLNNSLTPAFGLTPTTAFNGSAGLTLTVDTAVAIQGKAGFNTAYTNLSGRITTNTTNIATNTTAIATKEGLLTLTATKTANYTLSPYDIAVGDVTSGTFTFTLPNAPADGTLVEVKMVGQTGTNVISLAVQGVDVFNGGGTTGSLLQNFQAITFKYKLSNHTWYSTSTNLALGLLDTRYAASISGTGYSKWSGTTPSFITAIPNADLANSTISGISLGSNLANLTATDATLTFSGSYNGGTARTIGLNLSNANTVAALWTFPASDISIAGTTISALSGSGGVLAETTSPTFVTPTLGAATATSLTTSGNITMSAWGLAGVNLQTIAATYSDNSTAAGATVTNAMVNTFGQPTITASNATSGSKVTYTNVATVYIAGNPLAGTNTLFTNNYALNVNGTSNFSNTITGTTFNGSVNGSLATSSTLSTSNFGATSATTATTTNAPALFAGATTVNFRAISNSGANSTPAAGTSYATMLIGGASETIPSSGTNGLFASMVINPLTITTGAGTLSESATLYLNGAATNGVVNYALHAIGNSLFGGNISAQHHIGNTSAPTIAAGTGAGTSPTVSVSGNDLIHKVTILTGTTPTVSATVATITFNVAYGVAPKIILTPANAAAAALNGTAQVYVDDTSVATGTYVIKSGSGGLAASTTYLFYASVAQ